MSLRAFATGMSLILVSSLVSAVQLPASAAVDDKRPPVPLEKVIPHTDTPLSQHQPAAAPDAPRAAASWPGGGETRLAGRVSVVDQALSRRAGVTGVVMSVAGGPSVSVDYSAFRYAAGADFGSRLRLVQLPACALTTPEVPACQQQTPLPSRNDPKTQTVSAPLSGPAVVAAVGGASGSQGTFAASSLSPSGTWGASGGTGSFSWDYSIAVPPTAGPAPDVTLSYSSGSVDGRTAATNNQSSWVGQGWDYSPGFIERTYRACSVDETLPKAQQTDDQCWAGQIVTMSLNGSSTSLVLDPSTGWHAGSDNGSRIELVNDPGKGPYRGEYWKVTTTDGVSYYFGRNRGPGYTDQQLTNSAWTTPVYGPHADDPCHNDNFAQASCTQAWRWNLDFVQDPLGNVTAYYYDTETGIYGPNKGTAGVEYTRGGVLRRIDYGIRLKDNSMYGQTVPGQVLFDVTERCTPSGAITCAPEQFTKDNAQYWPDTPVDQNCKKGETCNNHTPTFWSTKRLSAITTQYNTGDGPVKVDTYQLTQSFPTVGDPELRLDKIVRTGYGKDGKSLVMPPVEFTSQLYANRVVGFNNMPQMPHWRLTNVWTETGSVINVTYTAPDCSAQDVPADLANDTRRCYPVYWGLNLNNPDPVLDWFHKYLVTKVEVQDRNGISPTQSTAYTYVGDPAWHFDDNETVRPKNRTYGQFRGYGQVETRTGASPDKQTLTRTTYYRGMDNDVLPGDKHRSAEVTNSLGEKVKDNDNFAGSAREVQTFDGDTLVSSELTDMKLVRTTATRARAGMNALTADVVAAEQTRTRTPLAAGGIQSSKTVSRYDDIGRLTAVTKSGDGVPDMCTTTTYADNTDSWIRNRAIEVITSQQACPAAGVTQSPITADVRTYFDNQAKLGVITGPALPTRTDTATANTSGALKFETTQQARYDASGRAVESTDAAGNVTKSTFTPLDGGLVTKIVSTNAKNQTATTELDPARGKTTATVDVGGHRTEGAYDQLGRVTSVWKPSRRRDTDPSLKYTYLQRTDGPSAITTQTLVDNGKTTAYLTSIDLFDGFGQLRQTQADDVSNPAGVGRRVAKDIFYDTHGWATGGNTRYLTDGPPSTTLISVADDAVEARVVNTFDNTGRTVKATNYRGLTPVAESRTIYGGDRVTTIPPNGGVPTTSVTDVRGNNTALLSYTAPPTITGNVVSGGAPQTTVYKYDAQAQLERMTDAAGNVWTYGYDFLGRQNHTTDPDSGEHTLTYDLAGQLTSTKDARGQMLSYDYDSLGRRTVEYNGKKEDNKKLATWEYDTSPGGLGQPAFSTRYTPQGNYITGVSRYDGDGNPAVQTIRIPTAETGLNGTYETTLTYTTTGLLRTASKAAQGGLPAEAIIMDYDRFGNAQSTAGYNTYVSASAYTPFREPSQFTLGVNNSTAWLTYDRDAQSRRVTSVNLSAQQAIPQIDRLQYSYDTAGNVSRIIDTQGASSLRTQCFSYDTLARLTEAWTATDNCAAAPSTANVGGPKPYWTTWALDTVGLRKSQARHPVPGTTGDSTTYSYPTPGANAVRPHAIQSATTNGTTTTYDYTDTGSTKTRVLPGGTQTLEWNEYDRLAKVTGPAGETSYVYDADGNQLLRRDPGKNTLFLPGEELTRNTTTGAVTGTRYYAHNGVAVALRVGNGVPQYLQADQHGTNQVSVSSTDFKVVTRREFDPYGNPVGSTTGTWPDSHAFLDKPYNETTGLSDVGARNYDSVTGRFLSVDPVLDQGSPQQWTGYTYANNNPTTLSDPTGLAPCGARPCSDPMPGCGARPCNDPMPGCGARPCNDPMPGCGARPCHEPPAPKGCGARQCNAESSYRHTKPKPTYPKNIPQEHTNYAQDQKVRKANLDQHWDRLFWSSNQDEFEEFKAAFCSDYPDEIQCQELSKEEKFHSDMDVLGLLGPIGPFADAANAIAYFAEGDWENGLANLGGMIPVIGDGGKAGWKLAKAACSFPGDTQVVLADGATKAIDQIQVGDHVLATDPATGRTMSREVLATPSTEGDKTFVDLTFAGGGKLTPTDNHPFWVPELRQWVPAGQLHVGQMLQTSAGTLVQIAGTRVWTAHARDYNLTVDDVHTYYVLSGGASALVHNTCPILGAAAPKAGNVAVIGRQHDTHAALDWPGHDVLNVDKWSIDLNDAWINAVIKNKQDVYVASPLTHENMWDSAAGRETVTARELRMLTDAGYEWDGTHLRPPRR
jgi:RHS repeat-associated protein